MALFEIFSSEIPLGSPIVLDVVKVGLVRKTFQQKVMARKMSISDSSKKKIQICWHDKTIVLNLNPKVIVKCIL